MELFFDIEADPTRDLVYLHGVIERRDADPATDRFHAFVAREATETAEEQVNLHYNYSLVSASFFLCTRSISSMISLLLDCTRNVPTHRFVVEDLLELDWVFFPAVLVEPLDGSGAGRIGIPPGKPAELGERLDGFRVGRPLSGIVAAKGKTH